MVKVEKKEKRIYVLDTNVLIHDPACMYKFDEHGVAIPMTVLEELDKHKNGVRDISQAARQVNRGLSDLTKGITQEDIKAGIPIERAQGSNGYLLLLNFPLASDEVADNRILQEVEQLSETYPEASVILVSKDINLRVKATAMSIVAEDYLSDQAFSDDDVMIDGIAHYESTEGREDTSAATDLWGELNLQVNVERTDEGILYHLAGQIPQDWYPGMLVSAAGNGEGNQFEARVLALSEQTATLKLIGNYRHKSEVWGVNAHDNRQNFALDLLMDDDIDLVTLAGGAGTGKTYMTLAAAFEQTLDRKRFDRIIFTRSPVPLGEDIGFLPGNEEEKMGPWTQAFHDNMENLLRDEDGVSTWQEGSTQQLLASKVQIRSPTFMRGRTMNDTLLIIDEAQNFTPRQIKGLISRAGRNTKVVCLGNVNQIDTPYLTPSTCGMAYLVQRFRSWPHAGHVTLKAIERSRLATAAEDLL